MKILHVQRSFLHYGSLTKWTLNHVNILDFFIQCIITCMQHMWYITKLQCHQDIHVPSSIFLMLSYSSMSNLLWHIPPPRLLGIGNQSNIQGVAHFFLLFQPTHYALPNFPQWYDKKNCGLAAMSLANKYELLYIMYSFVYTASRCIL